MSRRGHARERAGARPPPNPFQPTTEQHQLRTIARSGEHLLTLLNDILELARIESGRLTLNSAPCDLPQLIHDLEQMFLLQAHRKHLEFVVRRGEGLPGMVEADSTKLRQVLINLLGNAVKFTAAGGAVTLRVEALAGSRIRAEVEDTGPGIAADDLPRLFEPFFQTSAGRQVGGGTGLGLAISREFVRLMGGELTVRSQLGQGSVFRLEVPLPLSGPGRMPSTVSRADRVRGLASRQSPCRVLVVDDEADNREVLEHLLAPLGFEIRSAADGAGALAAAAEWNPHLILLDLRMPGIDGFEVTARLRGGGKDGPRILVLSATAFREDRERALATGVDRFLCKPFLEADLLECIRELTGVGYVYGEAPVAPGSPALAAPPPVSAAELLRLPAPLVLATRVEEARLLLEIGAAGPAATRERAELGPCLEAARERIRALAAERRVQLGAGPPNLGRVLGTAEHWTLVFHRLLEAAVRRAREESTLRLTATGDPGPGLMSLEIDGPELPAEALSDFFALRPATPPGPAGDDLGSGAALAERIVSLYGGRIRVENVPHVGLRWVIELPAA